MNLAPLHAASARAMGAQNILRRREDELDEAILACILEKCVQLSRRYPKRRFVSACITPRRIERRTS